MQHDLHTVHTKARSVSHCGLYVCDMIVYCLLCIDTSMQRLFDGGKLLSLAREWLVAPPGSSYLQATGALLIANMARSGEEHCVAVQRAAMYACF